MSHGWDYKSGDWWVICDVCSIKVNASKTRKRWDGFQVCFDCFENRHPQDFIKSRNDKISVPFTRPQPDPDTFINVPYVVPLSCTPLTSNGDVDFCVTDCARTDIKLMNDLVS